VSYFPQSRECTRFHRSCVRRKRSKTFSRGKRTIPGVMKDCGRIDPPLSQIPAARRKSSARERIRATNCLALPARLPGTSASELEAQPPVRFQLDVPSCHSSRCWRKLLDAPHERMRAGNIVQREIVMQPVKSSSRLIPGGRIWFSVPSEISSPPRR